MQIALRVHPDGVVVLGAADPVSLYAPGLTWEIVDDGHPAHGAGARPRRRPAVRARAALRRRQPLAPPHAGARAARAHRELVADLGRGPAPARARARRDHAQRADPARAVPRADRRDPGGRDDEPARGDRRRAQLGLPLLLAARRGAHGARAGRARIDDGGRVAARLHRPPRAGRARRRAPAAAVLGHGRRRRHRGRDRGRSGIRRQPTGARRQRRCTAGAARRLRPDRRAGLRARGRRRAT